MPRALAGGLSRTGKCGPCGERALREALLSIREKSGPVFQRYRDGITEYAASLWGGSDIPDTIPEEFTQLSLLEDTLL